ncbi:hypothetical protein GCM10020358_13150 [Amorphoplanes nipponensis]
MPWLVPLSVVALAAVRPFAVASLLYGRVDVALAGCIAVLSLTRRPEWCSRIPRLA